MSSRAIGGLILVAGVFCAAIFMLRRENPPSGRPATGLVQSPSGRDGAVELPMVTERTPTPLDVTKSGSDQPSSAVPGATDDSLVDEATTVDVRVLVVNGDSEPVYGASVGAWSDYKACDAGDRSLQEVMTDSAGAATLYRVPRTAVILAYKLELGASGMHMVMAPNDVRRADGQVLLILRAQAELDGVVTNADGSPASAGLVVIERHSWNPIDGRPRTTPPIEVGWDGTFLATIDSGGKLTAHARADGRRSLTVTESIPAGGHVSIRLQLPGHYSLEGRLLTPDGKPAQGGMLQLRFVTGEDAKSRDVIENPADSVALDGAGHFLLDLGQTGVLEVSGWAPAFSPTSTLRISITDQAPHQSVVLQLPPTSIIEGKLLSDDEQPIEGASVFAVPPFADDLPDSPSSALPTELWRLSATAVTDATGGFSLGPLTDGLVYTVSSLLPGQDGASRNLQKVIAGARNVILRSSAVDGPRSVSGRVVSLASQQPITSYSATLRRRTEGNTSSASAVQVTDELGRFSFHGLDAGDSYQVHITATSYAPSDSVWIEPDVKGDDVEITLVELGAVSIQISRSAGDAVSAIVYRLVPESTATPPGLTLRGLTDDDGMARIEELAPGRYSLEVLRNNVWLALDTIDILPGRTVDKYCTLPSP